MKTLINKIIEKIKELFFPAIGIGGIEGINHIDIPTPPPLDLPFIQEIVKIISQIVILIFTVILMIKKHKKNNNNKNK